MHCMSTSKIIGGISSQACDIRIWPKYIQEALFNLTTPTMEPRRHFYRLYKHCHLSFARPDSSSIARISSKVAYPRRCAHTITPAQKPRVFPGSGWENIDLSVLIEEESIPTYRPEKFYPVRIGETFNHQYQVVGKLGYGSTATVWLCRDLL